MELRHLRYFVALAEQLNFTQAAERVHVAQSTLSHQIKQLEDEIGQPLFRRSGKQLVVTEAGEKLLGHATRALQEVDAAVRALRTDTEPLAGEVRIGAGQSFVMRLVPTAVAEFYSSYPMVRVVLQELTGNQIDAGLRAGTLDLGVHLQPGELDALWFERLYTEELLLVVAVNHPWADRKRVRMAELHHQPLVMLTPPFGTRQMLDACFQAAGVTPKVVAEVNSMVPMLTLVQTMPVAAIMPVYPIRGYEGLIAIPIESPTPIRTIGILWLRDAPQSPAVKAFATFIRRAALAAQSTRIGSWSVTL